MSEWFEDLYMDLSDGSLALWEFVCALWRIVGHLFRAGLAVLSLLLTLTSWFFTAFLLSFLFTRYIDE